MNKSEVLLDLHQQFSEEVETSQEAQDKAEDAALLGVSLCGQNELSECLCGELLNTHFMYR